MRMKKLLFLLLFLASCATYEKYAQYLNGFIGADKTELLNAWGAPDASFQADRDTEYLTYKQRSEMYVPGTVYTDNIGFQPYVAYTPGYAVNEWCDTTFILQNDKVVRWETKGDDCVKD